MEKRVRTKTTSRRARNHVPGLYRRGTAYWPKFYHEGIPRRESLGTDDLSLAVAKAEILRRTPLMEPSGRWAKEVEEYIAERRRQDRLSVDFASSRRYCLLNEGKRMGWTHPARVTPQIVQAWYEELRTTNAENTTLTYLTNLRGFFTWLVEKARLRENPAKGVRMARTRAVARKNFLPRETVRKLIDTCQEPQLKFILFCGFHCGLRKGEINAARPDWFQLGSGDRQYGHGRLDVRIRPKGALGPRDPGWKPKNRKERSIPLTPEFRSFLTGGEITLEGKFVLLPHVAQGRGRYRYDFRQPLQAYFRSMGVSATAHDMRRSFASNKIIAGVSLTKVAKWIGDGYQTTYEHYSHLVPDRDRDIELGI